MISDESIPLDEVRLGLFDDEDDAVLKDRVQFYSVYQYSFTMFMFQTFGMSHVLAPCLSRQG